MPLRRQDVPDTVTYTIPRCVECPPLQQQPIKSVIRGQCRDCGGPIGTGIQAVRELARRRVLGGDDGR